MALGNSRTSDIRVKFSSMPESAQTLQANPSYVKRCACVVFSLQAGVKDVTHKHTPPPPPSPPLSLDLCPQMMWKET